jgi:site-specific DNA recombinase
VGYVRVSTDQQATEGVSLEAQQVRIRAHCVSQEIELVDIVIDEGFSAKSLERPGIKRALAMLTSNQANAIVVVKLDRLTRSVKDLGYLCDSYFREGLPYSLLSVSDSIDTRSASGKLMLNVLMSVAQWEREAISERTQEAMNELKRRGVRMGGAPYGWQYTKEPDEHGRRNIVIHPGEQKVIQRICAMHKDGLSVLDIAKRLTADGVRPRGDGVGTPDVVSNPRTRWTPDSAASAQEGERRWSEEARPDPRQDDRDPTGSHAARTGSKPAPDRRKAEEGQNPTHPWRSLARCQRA